MTTTRNGTAGRASQRARGIALAILLMVLVGAGCASVAISKQAAVPPDAPKALHTLAKARSLHDQARNRERQHDARCVDDYYEGAVLAAAAVFDGPAGGLDPATPLGREAISLYNASLADCLRAAPEFGRLDPRRRLQVHAPGSEQTIDVAIEHQGFLWTPDDFDLLVDANAVDRSGGLRRRHGHAGVGAPQIAVRLQDNSQQDQWLLARHPFPTTAVLDPDFDAWLDRATRPPQDRLRLVDPMHADQTMIAGQNVPLAVDHDAPINLLGEIADGASYRFVALLRPEKTLNIAGLYMLQPYEPGKIPVVLIHGLASSPLTWNDLIGDLRGDPAFRSRYQLWLFTYPTGAGFLRNAALLRDHLTRLQDQLDPDGRHPETRQAILIGHSMGGLIAKLQVTSSGDQIWDTYATRPSTTMIATPEIQAEVQRLFYFDPHPGVRRVIYVAVPHYGSNLANELPGRLSSALIRPLSTSKGMIREIERNNPDLIRPAFREVPTGVDLLERDHPLLLTMARLPVSPAVTTHSIIGTGTRSLGTPKGDSVVPIESARISGTESEVLVPENHGGVHHNEQTTHEIRRILDEHWDVASKGDK